MLPLALPPGLVVGTATSLIAFRFTQTVSIGVIILSGLAALATIVGIVYGVRWRIAYEVERKAREGVEALADASAERVRGLAHERNELLHKLEDATTAIKEAEKTVARLEALPNLERVLELMTDTFARITNRIDQMHQDNRAQAEKNTRTLVDAIDELRNAA